MLKFALKLFVIAAVAIGAYLYFTQDETEYHPTVDVQETPYQETILDEDPQETEDDEQGAEEDEQETEDDEQEDSEDADVDDNDTEPLDDSTTGAFPAQFNLAVPFTSQAPHADWNLPYQEACEEASAYMVSEYFKGTPSGKIDPDVADTAILDVVAFQEDFFGFYLDTTAHETAQFIDFYYGLHAQVIENPTVDQIKTEIAAGRPVIVPAAGRELGNPNFLGLGPLYHMFVIRGYTEDQFITNDPGTRNGEGFVYDIDVVMDAIGDWNNGDPASGAKRVIFVSP